MFMAILVIGLACGCLMSSCGDDKDEPTGDNLIEKLQGTWHAESMTINVMGQTIEMDMDDLRQDSGYDSFYDEVLTFNGTKVNGSEYKVKGNTILLPWYESADWWQSVSFSGNKMTLYLDVIYEGIPMKMWITYNKYGSRASFTPIESANSLISKLINKAFGL